MNLINKLLLFLLVVGFLGTLGCTYSSNAGLPHNAGSERSRKLQESLPMKQGTELSVSGQTMGVRNRKLCSPD